MKPTVKYGKANICEIELLFKKVWNQKLLHRSFLVLCFLISYEEGKKKPTRFKLSRLYQHVDYIHDFNLGET